MGSARWRAGLALAAIVCAACAEDKPPPSLTAGASDAADGTGTTDAATGAIDDGLPGSTGLPPADTTAGGSDTSPAGDTGPAGPLESLGTLVVLGDSIGDGGGIPPWYHDVLHADLEAHYGPIDVHNAAQSGSETDALLGQIDSLPASLPGPVAIVITSGGNDMKAAISAIVSGSDGPARDQMRANIDAALQAALAPDRFGAGVEVRVFEGNIYDASDGVGDYGDNGCAFGQGLPALPTTQYFESWNGAIEAVVGAAGQSYVDMHAHFFGHGYANARDNWYAPDCTHPNTVGHEQLAQLFFSAITGEPG